MNCKQPETNLQRSERRSSRQNARTEMQPGVMAGGALIPLSGGITPESLLFLHRMPLFIHLR